MSLNNRTKITFTNNLQRENTQQTVSFTDRAMAELNTVNNPLESTFMLADTSDDVAGFFERPQVIFTDEWTPGVTYHQVIDPWSLFFENPRVLEKLRNFYLLRAQLHVKVVVNSSPFYYGRLMVSYNPMSFIDSYTFNRPGIQEDFIQASQRPSVVINPSADEVAEMTLPYIYPRSALIIPDQEWKNMGSLTIADLNILQNANNVIDPITITVFCWASNVSYAQPTSVPIPVQGEYENAHPTGVVSAPASAVARYAAKLAHVPLIGKYARATELLSSAVGETATLFGYSKPRIATPQISTVSDQARRLANYNSADICETLALDVKQEVTIDPRVTGCDGADQMALVPLAMRESYLTTFNWDTSAPPAQLLFNTPVTPLLYGVNDDQVFFTPMGWVSLPFRYWRGSLKFRFEVVASKFHRGRLRLTYDPAYQATSEYNVNYSKIIDIVDGADVTMQVGWAQGVPYLPIPNTPLTAPLYSTSPITSRVSGANGILSMFVVNSLTTPNDSVANVTINVYVSACDDFEIQGPNTGNLEGLIINQNAVNPITPISPPANPNVPPPPGFGTTLGSYLHFIQTNSDSLAPITYGYTGVLLAASASSPNFDGDTNLSFNNTLLARPTPYDMTFSLVAPTAAPATVNVVLNGTTFPVTFGAPVGGFKSQLVTLTIPPNTTNATIAILSTDGLAWSHPLAVRDVRASFQFASNQLRMQDVPTTPVLGNATYTADADYAYWTLPPGASISCRPPAGILSAMMLTSAGGTSLSAQAGGQTTVATIATSTVPRQSYGVSASTDLTISSNVVLTNTGANELRVYSIAMRAIATQGDLVDELQVVAGDSQEKPDLGAIFFGESVVSIRQILKRYTTTVFIPPLASSMHYKRALPMLPVSLAATQLERVEMSLWKWFISAYVGWKGSTRARLVGYTSATYSSITRLPLGASNYDPVLTGGSVGLTNMINWNGSTTALGFTAPLAAELPWYSNKRFLPSRAAGGNTYFEPEMAYQVDIFTAAATGQPLYICNATGEDFSTYMFLCTPVVSPSP